MAADEQKLINTRRYIKGRITNLEKECDIDKHTSLLELNIVLERLRDLFRRLEDTNMALEGISESHIEEGLAIENKYTKLMTTVRLQLEHLQKSSCVATVDGRPSLPKMELPSFNGDYGDWMSFKDIYTSMVHLNSDISPVQKFFYLKSCLVGEAATLVSTLECTNENYTKAWSILIASSGVRLWKCCLKMPPCPKALLEAVVM